jgi:hypothetical protein
MAAPRKVLEVGRTRKHAGHSLRVCHPAAGDDSEALSAAPPPAAPDASRTSDLLRRVADFLPQLEAANRAALALPSPPPAPVITDAASDADPASDASAPEDHVEMDVIVAPLEDQEPADDVPSHIAAGQLLLPSPTGGLRQLRPRDPSQPLPRPRIEEVPQGDDRKRPRDADDDPRGVRPRLPSPEQAKEGSG